MTRGGTMKKVSVALADAEQEHSHLLISSPLGARDESWRT
jgi:hypothetical protein